MTLQTGLCSETFRQERYHESKQNRMIQKNTQLNKPKQLNIIDKI